MRRNGWNVGADAGEEETSLLLGFWIFAAATGRHIKKLIFNYSSVKLFVKKP
jgi:hypothetical protein